MQVNQIKHLQKGEWNKGRNKKKCTYIIHKGMNAYIIENVLDKSITFCEYKLYSSQQETNSFIYNVSLQSAQCMLNRLESVSLILWVF